VCQRIILEPTARDLKSRTFIYSTPITSFLRFFYPAHFYLFISFICHIVFTFASTLTLSLCIYTHTPARRSTRRFQLHSPSHLYLHSHLHSHLCLHFLSHLPLPRIHVRIRISARCSSSHFQSHLQSHPHLPLAFTFISACICTCTIPPLLSSHRVSWLNLDFTCQSPENPMHQFLIQPIPRRSAATSRNSSTSLHVQRSWMITRR
jgi:hypothetical protein